MKYTYIYKTSDGRRTEATINAPSRDEAFAALRGRGIRPIKVVSADGSKANGEMRGVRKRIVLLIAALSVVGTATVVFMAFSNVTRDPAQDESIVRLNSAFDAAVQEFGFAYASLGLSSADDYSAVESGADVKPMLEHIRQGQRLIDRVKSSFRKSFAAGVAGLRTDSAEYHYAETLLKARLADLNAQRSSLANRSIALVLLGDNRGKWRYENGRIVFADKNLERMFEYCLEGVR